MSDDRLLLRVAEAAELMGLSRSQAYFMVANGELPVVRIGRAIRIPVAELRQWIQDRSVSEASASPR